MLMPQFITSKHDKLCLRGLSEVGRNQNTEISAQSELITKPKPKDRAYRNRNRNCFSVKLLVYEATDYSIVVEKN